MENFPILLMANEIYRVLVCVYRPITVLVTYHNTSGVALVASAGGKAGILLLTYERDQREIVVHIGSKSLDKQHKFVAQSDRFRESGFISTCLHVFLDGIAASCF